VAKSSTAHQAARVSTVKARDAGQRDDLPASRQFDSSPVRRVAVERHVRTVHVVVTRALAEQPDKCRSPSTTTWKDTCAATVP
jgi:hypothetical protein